MALKIIFMGTPDFAVPILEAMAALTIIDQMLIDKAQCFDVERKS